MRTDGLPYLNGKAMVFPSLASLSDEFAQFYELFSLHGVSVRLYNLLISRAEGTAFASREPLISVISDTDIRMLQKGDLARDIEHVFNEFFSVLSGANDPALLAHCFVETNESYAADRSLETITSALINTVSSLRSDTQGLQREIRSALIARRGQTVLIIGNKGAGKSTFIDRFFRNVLKRSLREKCLVARVDLGTSTGDRARLGEWLNRKLIDAVEKALYVDGIPNYDELRGLFSETINAGPRAPISIFTAGIQTKSVLRLANTWTMSVDGSRSSTYAGY